MKTGICQMGFQDRMEDRLEKWYKGKSPHEIGCKQKRRRYVASLVNKGVMHEYATAHGIPLPHRYAEVKDINALDCSALPDRVVIKPSNSADSDCVMLFSGGVEMFSGTPVSQEERKEFVETVFSSGRFLNSRTKIIAEEFIQDYNPKYHIPRDFKVYVAGGSAHLIQVIDRNGPKHLWTQRCYLRDWTPFEDAFKTNYKVGEIIPKPPRLQELIDVSDYIAADISCFMRLDFFISSSRVVFGEFTSYPSAGVGFTESANKYLCELMDQYPDDF